MFEGLDLEQGVPICQKCKGLLKPNAISFGQQLQGEDLEGSGNLSSLSRSSDLMIVVGSTLVVQPAGTFPSIAKENGAHLAIIILSETPLDCDTDFVFHLKMEEFLHLIYPQPPVLV